MVKEEEVRKDAKPSEDAEAFDEAINVLKTMKQAEVIDEEILGDLNRALAKLSADGQRKFMDLAIVQRIVDKVASESEDGVREPGSVIQIGEAFSFKVPYGLTGIYKKWPVVASYMADANYTVVTPGGWVFKLTEGVIYDIEQGKECPPDHGYCLPSIVPYIIQTMKEDMVRSKRETERGPFGLGVRFLETGWAGKDEAIAGDLKGHDSDRDQV